MSSVRTRIAPSPTGPLHVGTARTALFNYLFTKKHGGTFVLRIEDTDLERSDPKYEKEILDSLQWLGIDYDEGPEQPTIHRGEYGPYRQSERLESYKKYLEKLLADGRAFYCFHTQIELEAERERLLTEKKPPIHVCDYRDVELGQAQKLLSEKPEHIIRFKTPAGRQLKFIDIIRGEISFGSELLGDFSLAKDLMVPLYNFAVVIDDYEMKISHVIRGEDHIANTPKQMLVQEALGFLKPEYAHLPLILGPDRSKLSKRHGAVPISEYKSLGYLPESLVNFMAFLGWNPGTTQEVFSIGELIAAFDISHVQKSGAVFNIEKLDWLNGEYIRKKSSKELTELCQPYLEDFLHFQIPTPEFQIEYIEKVIALEQPRLKKLIEVGERTDYFFTEPDYDPKILRWKEMTNSEVIKSLDKSIEILLKIDIEKIDTKTLGMMFLIEAEKMGDRGKLLWPLRAALSGKLASPGPFEIMEIIGKEKTLARLKNAKKKLA